MGIIASARLGVVLAILASVAACSSARPGGTDTNRGLAVPETVAPASMDMRRTPAELAAYARGAVVNILGYKDGDVIQSGTGFFIRDDGVLVTNLHVVAGADSLSAELSDGEVFDNVYVLARDERRDLIVLQIPATPPRALVVMDQKDIRIGEPVYVIGNPLGLQGTFSDGLVSGKRVEEGVTYIQITAPISEGSSGGPVMNEEGKVVGVATSFYADGQNLNMAVPARHASGLLALAGPPTRFELVAGELKTDEHRLLEARAQESREFLDSLSHETRASLQELGEYERQTAVRVIALGSFMAEEGWSYVEDVTDVGTLASEELDGMYVTLDRGSYLVAALCDDDCTDLDMIVVDSSEDLIGLDTEIDPEPMVAFNVPYRQEYAVVVEMVECAAADCVYSIVFFQEN